MKKIVLIIPPSPWLISDQDLPMLGILYISSFLRKKGFNVQVCDLSGIPENYWNIPVGDVYGITAVSPQFLVLKKIIEKLKDRDRDSKVVVGGVHATFMPGHILNNTLADICVMNEGEDTILEILNDNPIETIKGIAFKKEGAITINGPRDFIKELDEIPFPDRESIDFFKYSKTATFKYLIGECREATIMTGRGCPFKCSFCAQPNICQGKIRFRTVRNVLDEIVFLKNKYGIKLVEFLDDTFVLNEKRVVEISEGMKELDLKWHCLTRVDRCNEDILKIMGKNGCIQLCLGFESGSNKILEIINKKADVEDAYKAIKRIKKENIKIKGQLMVGLPFESDETVEETNNFIRKANEVDIWGLHFFQPIPGCDIWENPEKYDFNVDKNSDFSNLHTIGKINEYPVSDEKTIRWYNDIKAVINEKSIELGGALDA